MYDGNYDNPLHVYISFPPVAVCGFLPDPENGTVTINGTVPGSIATYTCDPGFNLIGDEQRVCQANGNWSENEPLCQSQFVIFQPYIFCLILSALTLTCSC